MGRTFQRGTRWWVQYNHGGKTYRESCGKDGSARKAVKLLSQRLGEIAEGRFIGPDAERVTFDQLSQLILEDYRQNGRRSVARVEQAIKQLRRAFEHFRAAAITYPRVSKYVAHRLTEAQPATVGYEVAVLRRMFTLAVRARLVRERPSFPVPKVSNARQGFLEEDDVR